MLKAAAAKSLPLNVAFLSHVQTGTGLVSCQIIFCLHFRNHVYMGESNFKPKKNRLDKMLDNIMHSTGHDHVK